MRCPPSVNWGRGQLMQYESVASFCARFSTFNGLSLEQTKQFFTELFGKPWSLDTSQIVNARQVARLLDEPVSVVGTIYPTGIYAGRKGVFKEYLPIEYDLYVPFCRSCIMVGYHSSFHELLFLEKCPFHQEEMQEMRCLGSGAYFTRYVRTLMELLRTGNSKWPEVNPKVSRIFRSDEFIALTRWKADSRFILLFICWLHEHRFFYPYCRASDINNRERRLLAWKSFLQADRNELYFRWLVPEIWTSRLRPAPDAAYIAAFFQELERLKIAIFKINRLL